MKNRPDNYKEYKMKYNKKDFKIMYNSKNCSSFEEYQRIINN